MRPMNKRERGQVPVKQGRRAEEEGASIAESSKPMIVLQ